MIAEHSIFTSLLGQSVTLHQSDKTGSGSDEREVDVSAATGDTSQTRSDKWKAKHEAMLKLAVSPKHRLSTDNLSSENNSADTEQSRLLKNNISRHESSDEEYSQSKTVQRPSKIRLSDTAEQIKKSENVKDVTRMSTSTRSMKPVLAL